MNSFQQYVLTFSRVPLSIIFPLNGLGIISQAVAAKELIEHGASATVVPFLMLIARTIEVVAGFSLALGIYPRWAAVAISAFLLFAPLTAHFARAGESDRTQQRFLKYYCATEPTRNHLKSRAF